MKANIDDQLTQAFSLFDAGRLEAAYVLYQQLLAEEAQLSKDQQWQLYMGLVYVLSAAKDYDGALQYAAKLLDMAQDDEDRHVALHQTAMVYRMRGQYLLALELLAKEREIISRTGNQPMKLAVNLYEVSLSALLEGDLPRAAATWPEAVIYAKAAGDAMTLGCVYRVKGQVLAAQDDMPQAVSDWQKARTYFEQAGDERACHEVQALLNNAASYL